MLGRIIDWALGVKANDDDEAIYEQLCLEADRETLHKLRAALRQAVDEAPTYYIGGRTSKAVVAVSTSKLSSLLQAYPSLVGSE